MSGSFRFGAEHAEQAAHLGQRAASGPLDRLQYLAGRLVGAVEDAPLGTGLEDDHRDVMGDHVVQLARDPCPFFDDRLAGDEVAFAFGNLCAPLAVADDATTSSITTSVMTAPRALEL